MHLPKLNKYILNYNVSLHKLRTYSQLEKYQYYWKRMIKINKFPWDHCTASRAPKGDPESKMSVLAYT